ncbi:sensor histidine kinase [Paenibacillus mendelii]|uniref:histidine kinase n=1 Tax=Paenibacillus mendelii TaxID=206163 RepID=A0ABV6JG87_9BACL|nr:HAMP domain-containing sensor histidine kinase [Paenibacillus mendelii]MCQ6557600.1 ATP-binding protein [Paenibacillus mendelii]
MLIVVMFASLWATAVVLLLIYPRDVYTRWVSAMFLTGGCSGCAVSIHAVMIPFMHRNGFDTVTSDGLLGLISFNLMSIQLHFLSYACLMSSIVFNKSLAGRPLWLAGVLLLLPPLGLLVFEQWAPGFVIELQILRIYAGVYIGSSFILYILGCTREMNRRAKYNQFRTTALYIPVLLWIYVSYYLNVDRIQLDNGGLTIVGSGWWRYNYAIIFLLLAAMVFFGLRYGILGIKLIFERHLYDHSMKTLTQGTSILNHSLKNEIQKIVYLSERIQSQLGDDHYDKAVWSIDQLFPITSHMLRMVEQMKEKADIITLRENNVRIAELLDVSLMSLQPMTDIKHIRVHKQYECDPVVQCDPLHISEAFSNLCMNALEAMEDGKGVLCIRLYMSKKMPVIEISDNGTGIPPEQVDRIFTPFFTSKKGPNHYGLGLSYCYGVLQKSGGSIKVVQTAPGQGTTFAMTLPKRKVIACPSLETISS